MQHQSFNCSKNRHKYSNATIHSWKALNSSVITRLRYKYTHTHTQVQLLYTHKKMHEIYAKSVRSGDKVSEINKDARCNIKFNKLSNACLKVYN